MNRCPTECVPRFPEGNENQHFQVRNQVVYMETDPSYLRGPDYGPARAEELTEKVGHTYGQFWSVFLNHISPHSLPNLPKPT